MFCLLTDDYITTADRVWNWNLQWSGLHKSKTNSTQESCSQKLHVRLNFMDFGRLFGSMKGFDNNIVHTVSAIMSKEDEQVILQQSFHEIGTLRSTVFV